MRAPYLRVLGARDLRRVHQASLRILERAGMLIEHAGAREILQAAGAGVDHETRVVRFPSELVEARLALVPRRIEYHGRTPEFDFACRSIPSSSSSTTRS